MTTAALVAQSVRRTTMHKMRLGLFDPIVEDTPAAPASETAEIGMAKTAGIADAVGMVADTAEGVSGVGQHWQQGVARRAATPASWASLTLEDLNSTHAQTVAYEAALQGVVLLKNKNAALPLAGSSKPSIAVVGPMATNAQLYARSIYNALVAIPPRARLVTFSKQQCQHIT